MDTHDASQRNTRTTGDDGADRPGWGTQPGSGTAGSPGSADQWASAGRQAPTPPGPPKEQSPPPPQPKGKRQSVVASLTVIVVLIALRFGLPTLFGEATAPGGLVHRTIDSEDFSDGPGQWGTGSSGTAHAEVSGGTYNMHIPKQNDELYAGIYLAEERWGSIAVEASVRPVGQARTAFSIGCMMSIEDQPGQELTSGTTYWFSIVAWRGAYVIFRHEEGGEDSVLEQGKIPAHVISGSGFFRLRATCRTTGGTTTDLAFFVGSEQLAATTDAGGPGAFNGMGISAYTMDPDGEVRFDDTVVKRI